jgi:hypothetical protein
MEDITGDRNPRPTDEIFSDLVRRLLASGEDETTVAKSATRMISDWPWFSDNSVDERGRATYLDWMDEEIIRLLDESERAHFIRGEPCPTVSDDVD